MSGQIVDRRRAVTARTWRVILLVRALATLSVLPLFLPPLVIWLNRRSGRPVLLESPLDGWAWLAPAVAATGLYLFYWLRVWPDRPARRTAALLTAMAVVVAIAGLLSPPAQLNSLWLYVAVIAGSALPPRWATVAIVLLAVLSAVALLLAADRGAATQLPARSQPSASSQQPAVPLPPLSVRLGSAAQNAAPLLIAGLGAMLVTTLLRTNAELHAARAEVARMAVEEERTRLARDLHDLLGHNLSVMAVRLELAGRLVGGLDEAAATEVREVQRMARDALRDVREAVGGYRQPTLEGELAGAALALEAAGIALRLCDGRGVLTPALEATCAWVVREAVTNVIQHSRARWCEIDLHRGGGELAVRVTDDGAGAGAGAGGMGLHGLGERVAAAGGTLTAGPRPAGRGFQLIARLPV